jgi:hypothetical protein
MLSEPSMKSGPVMMKNGGAVNAHKKMAMKGVKATKMMGGGMAKGYKKGGMC